MPSRRQRALLWFLLLSLPLLIQPAGAAVEDWNAPARELAEKIVGKAQSRSAVSITVKNNSSLTAGRAAEAGRAIEGQLRGRGVRLVSPDRAVDEVRVTLAENVSGYLWVAEVGHGDSWEVAMVRAPFVVPAAPGVPSLTIRRSLVWSQPEPILDTVDTGNGLLVLGAEELALYRVQAGRGEALGRAPLRHSRPWPRDLRGRLVAQPDGSFRAYLPGVQCTALLQPQFSVTCQESDDPWPLAANTTAFFSSTRNFFTGTMVPALARDSAAGPFYSAAQAAGGWVVTSLDGSAQLLGGEGAPLARFSGWGSDVAAVRSDCGSGWQLLVTRAGDSLQADSVQAYEVANREAAESGLPVEFAGPVSALWTTGDGRAATAVARNLKTGNYEAFSLSIACSR